MWEMLSDELDKVVIVGNKVNDRSDEMNKEDF